MVEDLIVLVPEMLSLALIVASFLIVAFLAQRAKTVKSLQFEMFVVLLVLSVAEIPRILSSLDLINISGIETIGLSIHTVSMVLISAFVSMRVARYFR